MYNPHEVAALTHIEDSRRYSGDMRATALALANIESSLAIVHEQQTANYVQLLETLSDSGSTIAYRLGIGRMEIIDLLKARLAPHDAGEEEV